MLDWRYQSQTMTFLNPLVLLALTAAAIPLILHLINLRRLRTVEFSSIAFLKELKKTRIRKLKIRQLLLLILRTLLILLIVFAFARPTLSGSAFGSIGSRARATAVLLIDDSPSMALSDGRGGYLKQSLEAAYGVLDLLEPGDEVFVIPLSSSSSDETHLRALTPSAARAVLDHLQPTTVHRKLESGVRVAAKLFARSENLVKELYILSDLQDGVIGAPGDARPESILPPDLRAFLIPVGDRTPDNLGVVSMTVPNAIVEAGRPFAVEIGVHNASPVDVDHHVVSVFLNGTRVAQRGLTIARGATVRTSFSVVPTGTGFQRLVAEIESDDLDADNQRSLALHIPDRVRVVLMGNRRATRYPELALSTRQASGSSLDLAVLPPSDLTAGVLRNADVVILTGPSDLTASQAELLASFLRAGKGLILFADDASAGDPSVYEALGLPPVRSVESVDAEFLEFQRVELSHPLFEGMFEDRLEGRREQMRALESPRVTRFARLQSGGRTTPIITLSNGVPFLSEEPRESGRVLIVSVSPVSDWSDLPMKGLFVPLMHRAVSWCSQEHVHQPPAFAGDPVRVPLEGDAGKLTLVAPSGAEADVVPLRDRAGVVLEPLLETGFTDLKKDGQIAAIIAVNGHPDESRTERAEPDAVERLLGHLGLTDGITTVGENESMAAAVLEVRHGVELWKHLLVAALLVALAEMAVARTSGSEVETGD